MKNEPRYVIIASNEPKPMGETLLDYARPLIQQLPHDHTLEELKAVVIFAAVLWNVQVVEDISGAVRCLSTKMPPRLRVRPAKGLVSSGACSRERISASATTTGLRWRWMSIATARTCASPLLALSQSWIRSRRPSTAGLAT